MKKFYFAAVLLVCSLVSAIAAAEPRIKNPFLFTLERNGKTSYLLGTIHFGVSLSDLPECVNNAMLSSDSFICETTEKFEDLILKNAEDMLFTYQGPGLFETLSPLAWSILREKLKLLGYNDHSLSQFRPGAVLFLFMTLGARALEQRPEEFVKHRLDYELIKYANGRIQGLETQGDRILPVTPSELDSFLLSINQKKNTDPLAELRKLIDVYRAGDLDSIKEGVVKEAAEQGTFLHRIIVKRNQLWMPRIERIHESAGNHFFFVGSAHLPGDKGLVSLAQAQGFKVTRVNSPDCNSAIDEDRFN